MSIEKTLKAPRYRYILNKMICRTVIPWNANTANNNVLLLIIGIDENQNDKMLTLFDSTVFLHNSHLLSS